MDRTRIREPLTHVLSDGTRAFCYRTTMRVLVVGSARRPNGGRVVGMGVADLSIGGEFELVPEYLETQHGERVDLRNYEREPLDFADVVGEGHVCSDKPIPIDIMEG